MVAIAWSPKVSQYGVVIYTSRISRNYYLLVIIPTRTRVFVIFDHFNVQSTSFAIDNVISFTDIVFQIMIYAACVWLVDQLLLAPIKISVVIKCTVQNSSYHFINFMLDVKFEEHLQHTAVKKNQFTLIYRNKKNPKIKMNHVYLFFSFHKPYVVLVEPFAWPLRLIITGYFNLLLSSREDWNGAGEGTTFFYSVHPTRFPKTAFWICSACKNVQFCSVNSNSYSLLIMTALLLCADSRWWLYRAGVRAVDHTFLNDTNQTAKMAWQGMLCKVCKVQVQRYWAVTIWVCMYHPPSPLHAKWLLSNCKQFSVAKECEHKMWCSDSWWNELQEMNHWMRIVFCFAKYESTNWQWFLDHHSNVQRQSAIDDLFQFFIVIRAGCSCYCPRWNFPLYRPGTQCSRISCQLSS